MARGVHSAAFTLYIKSTLKLPTVDHCNIATVRLQWCVKCVNV